MKKILLTVLITAVTAVMLGGCVKEDTNPFEQYTVGTNLDEVPDGIFLMQGDVLTLPYDEYKTFSGSPSLSDYLKEKYNRLIWYTSQLEQVPKLDSNDLVVFKSDTSIPNSFSLEAFEVNCVSIGLKGIKTNDAGRLILTSPQEDIHPASTARTYMSDYLEKSNLMLDTINGAKLERSMVNRYGIITGLEAGKVYRLGFYIGTRYYEADMRADTTFYTSKKIYSLSEYEPTKDGYIVLRLPEMLEPGLYEVNGSGTFYYEGQSTAEQQEYETEPVTQVEEETLPVDVYEEKERPTDFTPESEPETDENGETIEAESEEPETDENGETLPALSETESSEEKESSDEFNPDEHIETQ